MLSFQIHPIADGYSNYKRFGKKQIRCILFRKMAIAHHLQMYRDNASYRMVQCFAKGYFKIYYQELFHYKLIISSYQINDFCSKKLLNKAYEKIQKPLFSETA